jgi:hypothetical protein
MFRKFFVIALALAAAAVATPFAQGVTDPNGRQALDPLAVSYLQGQGFSPGEIKMLVGQGDPLAVSYLRNHGFPQAQATAAPAAAKAIDPLAVSYLQGQGFSPGQIKVLVGQADPLAVSYLRNNGFPQAPTQIVGASAGFDWADAGIGAGATLGLVLLLAGVGGALTISRQNRRRTVASA